MSTSCCVRSTFDSSIAPDCKAPRLPVPSVPEVNPSCVSALTPKALPNCVEFVKSSGNASGVVAPVVSGNDTENGTADPVVSSVPSALNLSVPSAPEIAVPSAAPYTLQVLAAVLTKYVDSVCELPSESYTVIDVALL